MCRQLRRALNAQKFMKLQLNLFPSHLRSPDPASNSFHSFQPIPTRLLMHQHLRIRHVFSHPRIIHILASTFHFSFSQASLSLSIIYESLAVAYFPRLRLRLGRIPRISPQPHRPIPLLITRHTQICLRHNLGLPRRHILSR